MPANQARRGANLNARKVGGDVAHQYLERRCKPLPILQGRTLPTFAYAAPQVYAVIEKRPTAVGKLIDTGGSIVSASPAAKPKNAAGKSATR